MATALITVEEEITCSICFEVFRDPHVLTKCLHTFCLPCIQQLDRGGRVECPQCRKYTNIGDIIADFKTQCLIDKAKKYADPVVITSKKCGMCENAEKSVKFLCKECTFYLCDSCEKMHKKIKLDKPHTVTTVSEIIQKFQKKVETSVKELENELRHIDNQSDNITKNIEEINKSMEIQVQQVRKFTLGTKKKLEENENHLTKLIEDVNKNLVKNLTEKQQIYGSSKREIQDKIKLLNEMIQSEDFQTLKENAESINENTKEQIKKIKASLPKVDEMTQSPVTVKINDSWNVKEFIQVTVDDAFQHNESTKKAKKPKRPLKNKHLMSMSKTVYSNLYRKTWLPPHTVRTGHYCLKMCEINNKIWCGGEDRITIYTKQCQNISTVIHDKLEGICSLALYGNNQVIVACESNGVHSLDTQGQYLSCIMSGEFSDVSVYGDYLHALQYGGQCQVIVFKYIQQQWEKVREIQLKYGTGHQWDRLCVTNTTISVSSYTNNEIYMYNTEGQLLQTFTNDKVVLLCDVNEDDKCLIACYDHKVCFVQNNTWLPFSLKGQKLLYFFHSFVDTDGNLWVGTIFSKTLAKYIPSS